MSHYKLPQGFIPVMLTPFQESGEVDHEKLEQLTNQYIKWGAVGLFANCLSSEMFELTDEERLAIIQTVLRASNRRVPVVATGTFGDSIEEMATFSNKVWRLGVDAVIILNNLLVEENESDEVFLEKLNQWMQLTPGVKFGFYECPVPYKRLISISVLESLLPTGRFIYHKDTSLSLESIKEKIQARAESSLGIYDAYMVHAVDSLRAGVNGLSCIQGNYFPELIVWLCENATNIHKQIIVNEVQQFFIDHMEIMHQSYPIAAKYVMNRRGFPISLKTRREVGELNAEMCKHLNQLMQKAEYLIQKLNIRN